jgi:hypothetical protein
MIDFGCMIQPDETGYFWRNLLRAVEVEPREARSLRGSSGIDHPITAIGVDKGRHRVVVISSEADPRTSAFIQSDLQLAIPDAKIIVGRPEMFNRSAFLAIYTELPHIPNPEDLTPQNLAKLFADSPAFNEVWTAIFKSVRMTSGAEFLEDNGLISQAVRNLFLAAISRLIQLVPLDKRADALSTFRHIPAEADALVGICGIPLHQFTETDAELVKEGKDLDAIRDLLKRLDTLQYFFPPPDQLALGLIDRTESTTDLLIAQLQSSIERGHPFGQNELVPPSGSLTTMIDDLQDRGYVVEGERTFEVTETGKSIRETVKFKPRERLVSKIINQFSFKLDFKDIFK